MTSDSKAFFLDAILLLTLLQTANDGLHHPDQDQTTKSVAGPAQEHHLFRLKTWGWKKTLENPFIKSLGDNYIPYSNYFTTEHPMNTGHHGWNICIN